MAPAIPTVLVPLLPVQLATRLSLGLIAAGLLLFLLAALQQRWRAH